MAKKGGTRISVVLIRGANVGGKTFRPTEVVQALPQLKLKSLGAAGTFVAQSELDDAQVVRLMAKALPFDARIFSIPGRDILRMAEQPPFPPQEAQEGVKRCLTVLEAEPRKEAPLPLEVPLPGPWEVQVLSRSGRYVFSHRRRLGDRLYYPNEYIEKAFGVAATTREWPTVTALAKVIGPLAA